MTSLENQGLLSFKFERNLDVYHVVSLFISSLAFIMMIYFSFTNLSSSIVSTDYNGILIDENQSSFYFFEAVPPPPNNSNHYITFFLMNWNDSEYHKVPISVQSNAIFQYNDIPSQVMKQNYSEIVSNSKNKICTTKILTFNALILQFAINLLAKDVKINNTNSLNVIVRTIYDEPNFGYNTIFLRVVFSILCLFAIITFLGTIFVMIIFGYPLKQIRFEQVATVVSLFFTTLSNFPFSFYFSSIYSYIYETVLSAITSTLNLAFLYLFVHKANGKNIYPFLPIVLLFAVAQSFYNISSDSTFLNFYFDNNIIIWTFFFIVSVVLHLVFIGLFVYNIFFSLCSTRSTRRKLFISYLLAFSILIISLLMVSISFQFNDYSNFSLSFCYNYMAQAYLSLIFADIHWPLIFDNQQLDCDATDQQQLTIHEENDETIL